MQCTGNVELLYPGESEQPSYCASQFFCFDFPPVCSVSVTWATGSLTCVRDHSYACIYTWGLGTLTSRHNILVQGGGAGGTLTKFSCAPDGVRTSGLWILSRCTTNWATPSPVSTVCSVASLSPLLSLVQPWSVTLAMLLLLASCSACVNRQKSDNLEVSGVILVNGASV